jgi:formylglycine-generating enzyme required for sulfatase activity
MQTQVFFLALCPRKQKTHIHTETWALTHTASPSPQPEPRCPTIREWVDKMRCEHTTELSYREDGSRADTHCNKDDPGKHRTKSRQTQSLHANSAGFGLYDMPKISKSIETESR